MSAPSPDHHEHRWLTTLAEIAAEAPAWDRLVDAAHGGNPFLLSGWHLLWLRHFGEGRRLCYLKVTHRDRAVAYFPFTLGVERFHGVPLRVLRLAGNLYSPLQCPVVAPGAPPELFHHVAARALPELPWTVLLAGSVPLDHPGPPELHAALCAEGHTSHLLPGTGNWHFAPGATTAAGYLASRHRLLRRVLRQAETRLGELGDVECTLTSSGLTEEDIAAYRSVYDRSWKERELDPTFHPALMRWASEIGCLRLFTLRVRGRPIAAQLWLCRAGRAYAVKAAYDEAHRALSPGHALMARALTALLDGDRVTEIDLLKGDERYKRTWCDARRQRLSLVVFSRGAAGMAAGLLDRCLLPWARQRPWFGEIRRIAGRWVEPDSRPS